MSAVENRNKVEVDRLQQQISRLSKENDSLKEHLKKYVDAIQLLQRDDPNIQDALEGLNIDEVQLPDYKSEAKLFERKLVQVKQ